MIYLGRMFKTDQLNCSGSGLKCQVCGNDGSGVCSSDADNGESMECPEGLDVCYYYFASKNLNYL